MKNSYASFYQPSSFHKLHSTKRAFRHVMMGIQNVRRFQWPSTTSIKRAWPSQGRWWWRKTWQGKARQWRNKSLFVFITDNNFRRKGKQTLISLRWKEKNLFIFIWAEASFPSSPPHTRYDEKFILCIMDVVE